MFCPNCGKEINDNSNFCLYCGHKFMEDLQNEEIYSHSYYKNSYKKKTEPSKEPKRFSFAESFLKGIGTMVIIFLCLLGFLFIKNIISGDFMNFDKSKYQQYVEDPSMIPELTQPETLDGLISNLKDVQNFLELYLKFSDDDNDTKMETFDKYRKELLKLQNFNNTNILNGDVRFQIPRTKKEFNSIQKEYAKTLSKVGLMLEADESYSKYHLIEDARFTYKRYGKYMSADVNEYLKLRAKHYHPCMHKDELIIKPNALAKRIGDYENFMNTHKDFRYSDEVKDLLFSYTFVYSFTSDRTDMKNIKKNVFKKSDKKFLKTYPNSQLKELFSHLISSANGISASQFDSFYPYEYQKGLNAIQPNKSDLADIFSTVRKSLVQLRSDDNFQYMYISSTDSWSAYDPSKSLKKGDVILASSENGYDVYDYKYKKTNQTIQLEDGAKFFLKENQLFAYSQKHLQIQYLESSYGSFSFRPLSVKGIKKIFPNILIINIDTFGELSVQIDKPTGAKTYMLISTSGGNYDGYKLSGNIEIGELSNIFTVSSDSAQVNWTPTGEGDSYHMYFITQQAQNTSQTEQTVE